MSQQPAAKRRKKWPKLADHEIVEMLKEIRHLTENKLQPQHFFYVNEFMSNPRNINVFPCYNAALTKYAFIKYIHVIDKNDWLSNMIFHLMLPKHIPLIVELVRGPTLAFFSGDAQSLPSDAFEPIPLNRDIITGSASSVLYDNPHYDLFGISESLHHNPHYVNVWIQVLASMPQLVDLVMDSLSPICLLSHMQPLTDYAIKDCKWKAQEYRDFYTDCGLLFKYDMVQDTTEWKDVIAFGLSIGVDINSRNQTGETILFQYLDEPERVAFLIDHGAIVSLQDQYGRTPLLHLLQRMGSSRDLPNESIVRLLVEADPSILYKSGQAETTPLNFIRKCCSSITIHDGQVLSTPDDILENDWKNLILGIVTPLLSSNVMLAQQLLMWLPVELGELITAFAQPRFAQAQQIATD